MPQGDRTGPLGQGPLTGRGLGPCGAGAGVGFRRGLGRGMGRKIAAQIAMQPFAQATQPVVLTEAEEKKILEADLKDLKAEKTEIEKRLKELSTK